MLILHDMMVDFFLRLISTLPDLSEVKGVCSAWYGSRSAFPGSLWKPKSGKSPDPVGYCRYQ